METNSETPPICDSLQDRKIWSPEEENLCLHADVVQKNPAILVRSPTPSFDATEEVEENGVESVKSDVEIVKNDVESVKNGDGRNNNIEAPIDPVIERVHFQKKRHRVISASADERALTSQHIPEEK